MACVLKTPNPALWCVIKLPKCWQILRHLLSVLKYQLTAWLSQLGLIYPVLLNPMFWSIFWLWDGWTCYSIYVPFSLLGSCFYLIFKPYLEVLCVITMDSCLCWFMADNTKKMAPWEQHLTWLWARRLTGGGMWLLWVISDFTSNISHGWRSLHGSQMLWWLFLCSVFQLSFMWVSVQFLLWGEVWGAAAI